MRKLPRQQNVREALRTVKLWPIHRVLSFWGRAEKACCRSPSNEADRESARANQRSGAEYMVGMPPRHRNREDDVREPPVVLFGIG